MPGFLLGDLSIAICGEASMLSASFGKMFHLCMLADFIWRNVQETVRSHCFEKILLTLKIDAKCVWHVFISSGVS